MLLRYVNAMLLALVAVLGVTGGVMLMGTWAPWLFDAHRIAGWALIGLAPWKAAISYRSLKRGLESRFDRSVVVIASIVLAALVVTAAILGVMWQWRIGPFLGPFYQTLIASHWILGLAALPLVAFHAWRRWPKPRVADIASRRGALRTLGLAAAGFTGWLVAEPIAQMQATADRPRRFTGSRGYGEYTANAFPLTGESTLTLDAADWRLAVSGAVHNPLTLRYDDLSSLPRDVLTARLDCTSGWYTVQRWEGVPLLNLLAEARPAERMAGVRIVSTTGYNHTFLLQEVPRILLATHVGGEPLAAGHGYPLRAIIPDRRGWFWVKWIAAVDVLDDPLEIIGRTVWSPRQVLRQF
jgi:DMSO/TMAO reductase YedYZ molybdopterin-dependent catalytic subunit